MTTPTNTTTNGYIETRPEAIAAIHSAAHRWKLRCEGERVTSDCELCGLYGEHQTESCPLCPLERSYGVNCLKGGSHFDNWFKGHFRDSEPAEAMLEALVQLLPESERVIYGGK